MHASPQTTDRIATPTPGSYAAEDFIYTLDGERRHYFAGEPFPIERLDLVDARAMRLAGKVGDGTPSESLVRHGRNSRIAHEAKQRARSQAAEVMSEAELEAATAPATPKKKR